MRLPYGALDIVCPFEPSDFTQVLEPLGGPAPVDLALELAEPLASLAARLRTRRPRSIAILVEDQTRKNRELPAILAGLRAALGDLGAELRLIAAYGTHRAHTPEEHRRAYGEANIAAFRVIDHACRDASRLRLAGRLPDGHPVSFCTEAVEADIRIMVGSIEPHVFAGYTGGRKMLLPGIADYESIRRNHARVLQPFRGLGALDANPIHAEMAEAARLLPVDFALQLVRNAKGEAIAVMAGDLDEGFEAGVRICRAANTVKVPQPADLTVVTPGGLPKDMSLYQTNRALTAARLVTRPGGTVLLVGLFQDGVGSAEAEGWLRRSLATILQAAPEDIQVGGHNAVCLARNLQAVRVVIASDWTPDPALGLEHVSLDELASRWASLKGASAVRYLMPNGSCVVPELDT